MPDWSKNLHVFGAGLSTAAAEWRLRRRRSAVAAQARTFRRLLPRLGATSFWRAAGVEAGLDYATFARRIPPQDYDAIAPAIGRMARGETSVLWPGRCPLFAISAGTAAGQPKYLPVTDELLAHFRTAGFEALLYYTVRTRHAGVFHGRHLLLGGGTPLTPILEAKPHEAFAGDLSAISTLSLPPWVERHLHEPGSAIAGMSDWTEKIAAIVTRTAPLDISLVAGMPNWLLVLAAALREHARPGGRPPGNLQELWPNLECCMHSGVPVGPFQEELRLALGPDVRFHEVYPASEGFIAAQDGEPVEGLRLMTDQGLFFEFLPMADFDGTRLAQLAPKVVPLDGVKPGVDYALLLTTPAGLVRHVIGDVVRFTSTTPPRLVYVGRTELRLNAFGENVPEKDLTDALVGICRRQSWMIANFHVAPFFSGAAARPVRGRHEWWIELRPGTNMTPKGPEMAAALDTELQRLNAEYAARRRAGGIEAPLVRLVMPGVFEHWLTFKGKWGGQNKTPRCRSDRAVADELAQITNFAAD